MSSSHVCILKQEIINWNSEFLLLHLNYFHSLLSLKALEWESIPECVCILGHNWKQNNVICFLCSSLHSWNFSCDISMSVCLSSVYSKEVIICTLLKRSLLDFFRYYQFFLLCSLKVISLFCNIYSYCSYLLYLSYFFLYFFYCTLLLLLTTSFV